MRSRIPLLLILIALSPLAVSGKCSRSLKDQLAKQGFTGVLQGKVQFAKIGRLRCNDTDLSVYFYSWEESHPPGKAIHAAYRVLFMSQKSVYLGSYSVEDRPATAGPSAITFGYSGPDGNAIQCDAKGLPSEVLLSGEPRSLAR